MKVSDKISGENIEGTTRTGSTKKKSGAGSSDKTASASGADSLESAKVKLSQRAQDMKKIKEVVDNVPDVNEAKVAKLKSMIAKGEYKVDAKKVADKLVDEHAYTDLITSD